ncbi:hypothetical protein ATANTOWER_011716 [Ataeniobius toweri]|uniref:Secreted protein n=1 Tax=Ataeniobius toweri TaxID=208326 RepID=A0ABU7A6G2_9TELE|nr:hypothetical protein [Ataeniobius toweri]
MNPLSQPTALSLLELFVAALSLLLILHVPCWPRQGFQQFLHCSRAPPWVKPASAPFSRAPPWVQVSRAFPRSQVYVSSTPSQSPQTPRLLAVHLNSVFVFWFSFFKSRIYPNELLW